MNQRADEQVIDTDIGQKVSQFIVTQPIFVVLATASVYSGTYTDRLYPLGRFLDWQGYISIALSAIVPITIISMFHMIILYIARRSNSIKNVALVTVAVTVVLYLYLSIGFLSHSQDFTALLALWYRFAVWMILSLIIALSGNILYISGRIGPWAHAVLVMLAAVNSTAHLASERGRLDAIGYECTTLGDAQASPRIRVIFWDSKIFAFVRNGILQIETNAKEPGRIVLGTPLRGDDRLPLLANVGEVGGGCVT